MKNFEKSAPEINKDDHTVYISNLSYKLDRNNLKNIFSNFGEVKQVKLVMDLETEKSKGMAFVRMSSPAEVNKAIKGLNQQIIDGRTVKVSHAIPMKNAITPAFKNTEPVKEMREFKKSSPSDAPTVKRDRKKKRGPVSLADFLAEKAMKANSAPMTK